MNRTALTQTTARAYTTEQFEGFPIRFSLNQTVWSEPHFGAEIVLQSGSDFGLSIEEAEKAIEVLTKAIEEARATA